jgi:uncharacterized protein DUF1499
MKPVMMLFYATLIVAISVMAYVRLAPSDASLWHRDPQTAASTGKPNEYRLAGDQALVLDITAAELAVLVDDFVLAQPRVTRLAGSSNDLMMTYVQRSMSMGYPDYITIKITPLVAEQSKLEILSRSRFGYSDLGVNKTRVNQWVAAINRLVAG